MSPSKDDMLSFIKSMDGRSMTSDELIVIIGDEEGSALRFWRMISEFLTPP
jgi:hypothetical protein